MASFPCRFFRAGSGDRRSGLPLILDHPNLGWLRNRTVVKQNPHKMPFRFPQLQSLAVVTVLAGLWFGSGARAAAGVTIITHGLDGNVAGWVTGMATNVPGHPEFRGTNFSCYNMTFVPAGGGGFTLSATRTAGVAATNSNSGAVIIKLDWSGLADGDSYDTFQVAAAVLPAVLSTNFISELGGHALAEFPLHFIGHSRGGSLLCEVSRLLGTNGIWVDHLTTLDPHPLNAPGFPWDGGYNAVDAPMNTYENVLFHDNYWQSSDFFVFGQSVAGAFVRKLSSFSGGYSGIGGAHSDVHLWYHGTINTNTPTSDTEVSLLAAQRTAWWAAYETQGARAGFIYSLIGGADRTSMDQPVGQGFPMIRDGYNQWWDLGAGVANNRTALPANSGAWPSVVKFNRTTTNRVEQGQALPVKFYYQWAQPGTSLATLRLYLDADLNPLNTNQTLLQEIVVPGTGAGFISFSTTNLTLAASNATPGVHTLLATISGGGRTRHLYAPEAVEVIAPRLPPTLDIVKLNATQYRIGVNGEAGNTVVLQSSPDLQTWTALATNTLVTSRWDFTNTPPSSPGTRYYRGVLP